MEVYNNYREEVMSVGTNENEKIVNEIDNNVIEEIVENSTVETVQDTTQKIDMDATQKFEMQATQRLDFLGELRKDTEKAAQQLLENQQGVFAFESSEIQDEKVEKDVEQNEVKDEVINIQSSSSEVSTEPIAHAEISSESNVSNNNVQDIPEKTNDENDNQAQNQNTQNSQVNEIDEGEVLKKKEKQHAQDKKDYRLERMLFERINKMQGKIKESLELIKKFERINAKEENLPNIVTTLHDKLTQEVIKQFRTVGIEFNMKSYLVQAVVSDLLCKFEEGITEFRDCSENLNFVREVQDDFESRVELAPTSRVKNLFARLRGIFKPERKQERLEELERERQEKKLEEANIHLIKYKFINSELQRYTIKKNIVNSLTREILHGQGSGTTLNLKDFVAEKIEPEMKKLGLDGLIPELENKIIEEYKEKQDISNEEFEKLSIGEIRKNMKSPRIEVLRNKVNTVVSSSEKEEERLAI